SQMIDGVGSEARFAYGGSIWSDGRDVYVSDNNQALRKVELATGRVTTIFKSKAYGGTDVHSINGMWGMGRRLYYLDQGALWNLNLDSGAISRMFDTPPIEWISGMWGDGTYLYVAGWS